MRTFAFFAELREITDLFEEHPVEHALGLVFGGDVLDVDANSDYGAAFGAFSEASRRPSPDGRRCWSSATGAATATTRTCRPSRRPPAGARETIWPTPEPRYSWGLGGCDLPLYAEYCSRVRVVRDPTGLETAAAELATETSAGDGALGWSERGVG